MMPRDPRHESGDGLEWLMTLTPDPERAERLRARCRTQLGRSQRRAARRAGISGSVWHVIAPVVVGGFCVVYVALLVVMTLRLRGVFP